jgi:hypothetical protein
MLDAIEQEKSNGVRPPHLLLPPPRRCSSALALLGRARSFGCDDATGEPSVTVTRSEPGVLSTKEKGM